MTRLKTAFAGIGAPFSVIEMVGVVVFTLNEYGVRETLPALSVATRTKRFVPSLNGTPVNVNDEPLIVAANDVPSMVSEFVSLLSNVPAIGFDDVVIVEPSTGSIVAICGAIVSTVKAIDVSGETLPAQSCAVAFSV